MLTDNDRTAHGLAPLLTIRQTASVLQVSVKTVRRWIKGGDLVAHRIGRQLRISRDDLQTFIKLQRMV